MSQKSVPLAVWEKKNKSGDLPVCPCKCAEHCLNVLFQMHFPFPKDKSNNMHCV